MLADTVFVNARVWTMAPATECAEAVAVSQGRVLAVGDNAAMRDRTAPGARVYDVNGLALCPGFNDCHMHILGYGLALAAADLSPQAGVRDAEALVRALREWHERNPDRTWVRGVGYNQNAFPETKHIGRRELDRAFPNVPVLVRHTSGHACVVNTAALRAAGITPETTDPEGGEIVRDASGQPTGVLLETAAALLDKAYPLPSRAEMAEAIRLACHAMVAKGITSASDMGIGPDFGEEFGAYRDAIGSGAAIRMTLSPEMVEFGEPDAVPDRDAFARDFGFGGSQCSAGPGSVRLGPLKLYADGALTTRTAALRQPFIDGSGSGMLLHEPEVLGQYVAAGHASGWQLAVHAIGDHAIAVVLGAYEACGPAVATRRHRIEHAMLCDQDLLNTMKRLGVVAVAQPEFVARLGDAYVLGLGEDRACRLNPTAGMLAEGIAVAFSSDCPVVPGAPLDGIRAAVSRRTPIGRILGPNERITALDALRAYTAGAAFAVHDETNTGSIEPGMRADLVVLSAEPDGPSLDDLRVEATIIGGTPVYGDLAPTGGCRQA